MQLNCKVKKKKKGNPPFLYELHPFQCYPPFLAKFLVPPHLTQFLEGPTPPLITRGGGGSNYGKS